MRKITRLKAVLFMLIAGCTQMLAQQAGASQQVDPCRKENALKSENLSDGQVVMFKAVSGTNSNWINWAGKSTTAPGAENLFVIKVVNSGATKQVKLQKMSTNQYLKKENNNTISFTATDADATALTPSNVTLTEGGLVFPAGIKNTDQYTVRFTADNQYLNTQRPESNPKFANGTGGYSATLVYNAKGYATDALNNAIAKVIKYKGFLGNDASQYKDNDNIAGKLDAAEKALDALNKVSQGQPTLEQLTTALSAAQTLSAVTTDGLVLNVPSAGFYRIKSANGKYISNKTNQIGNLTLTTNADKATVFYLSTDRSITGSNFINLNGNGTKADGLGDKYAFTAHASELGHYIIKPGNTAHLYAETDFVEAKSQTASKECAWLLEEVKNEADQFNLTKNMPEKYATFAAPAAMIVPTGVKAYTVVAQNGKAVLTEIVPTAKEAPAVIPAGTAVLLEKTGNETSFIFKLAASADENTKQNDLRGVYAETEIPTTAFILGKGSNGSINFYKVKEADRKLAANKAYLTVPAGQASLQSIIIGGQTTGIDEIVTENSTEVYFDLQGRRVQNPTKGIYVTKSGKKVIFN